MAGNISGVSGYKLTATVLESLKKNTQDEKLLQALEDGIITTIEFAEIEDDDVRLQIVQNSTYIQEGETASSGNTTGTDSIDEAATLKLQQEVTEARKDYEAKVEEEEGLRDELDAANSTMEDLQAAMETAVERMQSKAEDNAENANGQAINIQNKIKNGQMTQEEGKQALNAIGFGNLSAEERTIGGIQYDVESLSSKMASLSDVYKRVADTIGEIADTYGQFLDDSLPIENLAVTTTGQIIVNEIGTGGPAQSGADGISASDMARFAAMSTDQLTKELEGGSKAILDAMNAATASSGQSLTAQEAAGVIKELIAGQAKGTGDASAYGTKGSGAQINIMNGIDKDAMNAAASKVTDAKAAEAAKDNSCDPYEVTIDGKTYQFIKDNGDGKWDTADIFGINDTKDDLFKSMKSADLDGSGDISPEELAKMGIRLVQVENGKLQVNDKSKDFDLSKVDSINLATLRGSNDNNGDVGTFGHFDMKLKDGRTIEGKQTFEHKNVLEKLFDGVKKFFSNMATAVINKFALDPDTVKIYSGIGEQALDTADLSKQYSNTSIEAAETTLKAAKTGVGIAASQDYGTSKTEEQPKPAPEPKAEDPKKKKPEEVV